MYLFERNNLCHDAMVKPHFSEEFCLPLKIKIKKQLKTVWSSGEEGSDFVFLRTHKAI